MGDNNAAHHVYVIRKFLRVDNLVKISKLSIKNTFGMSNMIISYFSLDRSKFIIYRLILQNECGIAAGFPIHNLSSFCLPVALIL